MWIVSARGLGGGQVPLQFTTIDGNDSTMEQVIAAARRLANGGDLAIPWHLLSVIADRGPIPWADAIPTWAPKARDAEPGSRDDFSVGYNDEISSVVVDSPLYGMRLWHERTTLILIVPAEAAELKVGYRLDGLKFDREILPTLDGRLYAGSRSAVLEFEDKPTAIWPSALGPVYRWTLGVLGRPGIFVGRIVRHIGFGRRPPPPSDPAYNDRLTFDERNASSLTPRLDQFGDFSGKKPLAIVIHGTFSCAVDIANQISRSYNHFNVARFEHDTFPPIVENARDLLKELGRVADAGLTDVFLVGHSRGGLVRAPQRLRRPLRVQAFRT